MEPCPLKMGVTAGFAGEAGGAVVKHTGPVSSMDLAGGSATGCVSLGQSLHFSEPRFLIEIGMLWCLFLGLLSD